MWRKWRKSALEWLVKHRVAICLLLCVGVLGIAFDFRDRALVESDKVAQATSDRAWTPDRCVWGYTEQDVVSGIAAWKPGGKSLFVWTQLTLDVLLPFTYAAFFIVLIRKLFDQHWTRLLRALVIVVVICDFTENGIVIALVSADELNLSLVPWASFITRAKWLFTMILSAVVGVRLLFVLRRRHAIVLDQAIRLRFAWSAFIFLCSWSAVACWFKPLQPLVSNILLIEDQTQLISLATINTLAIIFTIAIWRRLEHQVHQDVDPDYHTERWPNWLLALAGALGLITPLIAFRYTWKHSVNSGEMEAAVGSLSISADQSWYYAWGIALAFSILGALVALCVMYVMGLVFNYLLGSNRSDNNFFPFESRDKEGVLPEYIHKHASEVELTVYLSVLLIFFFGFLRPVGESSSVAIFSLPAYVVLVGWMTCMILAGLSAWLDYARIPVLLVVVFWVIANRYWTSYEALLPVDPVSESAQQEPTQSLLELVQAEASLESTILGNAGAPAATDLADIQQRILTAQRQIEDNAWQAISARLQRLQTNQKDKTLVIVTCPGGGIHAAAWAAYALEQLDRRYTDFADSVCVISAVSGGSVGALFYVNSQITAGAQLTSEDRPEAWRLAAESSLGTIGAGLAFDDLPAMFVPRPTSVDRGIRLERSWRERMGPAAPQQQLQSWGQQALFGELPVVVMNATDAASGRRVLFSTVPTPRRVSLNGHLGRPLDIRELFDAAQYDIHMTTAARASATFPYVSPFTKPQQAVARGKLVALGDGGYADNEGIVTAVDWLDFIGRRATEEEASLGVPFSRILLLRIQPRSDIEPIDTSDQKPGFQSTVRWLFGPLEALATMRSSSQMERGQLEVDLSATYVDWNREQQESEDGTEATKATAPKYADSERALLDLSSLRPIQATIFQREMMAQKQIMLSMSKGFDMPPPEVQSSTGQTQKSISAASAASPNGGNADPSAAGDDSKEWLNYPVLIRTIPFVASEPEEPIPLNWKLSPRQKKWYPAAWEKLLSREDAFFKELDEIFERRR